MKKIKLPQLILLLIPILFLLFIFPNFLVQSAEFNPNVTIEPELDISRFSPYQIFATNVLEQENLDKLEVIVSGKNGNPSECWDYFVDGSCDSRAKTLDMTYNSGESRWESDSIYPDYIYPEIYFAPSETTWYNQPLETQVNRNNYHILHYENSFNMVGDMSFWIEFNAIPNNSNSANLEIYLVSEGISNSFFQSDWRNSSNIELVGTLDNSVTFHHTHTSNSSHHLVSLATNSDGTVGNNSLDISDDFWIILYSKSPNNARGWSLRYQPSNLCQNEGRWIEGNQQGWGVNSISGCPDAHIHIARRTDNMDGVDAQVKGTYNDSSIGTKDVTFYFGSLPNLPPNATRFKTPSGGTYEGTVTVEWEPATDANEGDNLSYTINLLNSNGSVNKNLVSDTANTSFSFDTTSVSDGEYSIAGEVCDDYITPACTEFNLAQNFFIENTDPIYSISAISINSSNTSDGYAKVGDFITLSFTATGSIDTPTVEVYSGNDEVTDTVTVTEISSNTWEATYTTNSLDTEGYVTFVIYSDRLDGEYFEPTDSSVLYFDKTVPTNPSASVISGTYESSFSVTLTSSSDANIRYSTNGTTPTCSSGQIFSSSILIDSSKTLKAVACDDAGNLSGVSSYQYVIEESEDNGLEDNDDDNDSDNDSDNTTNYYYSSYSSSDNEDDEEINEEIEDEINEDIIVDNPINDQKGYDSADSYITKLKRVSNQIILSEFKVKIVDKSNNPISNLRVKINSEIQISTTDVNGIATFTDISTGIHTVSFRRGLRSYKEEITIDEPDSTDDTVQLEVITIVADCKISPIYWVLIIMGVGIASYVVFRSVKKNRKE